jgi:hypothetical protein
VEISLSASSLTESTMDRTVGFWKILAWTGLLLAGAVYMVDPRVPLAHFAAPNSFLAAEYVEPGPFSENQATGASAYHDASATNDATQLFGMDAEPVAMGELPGKWHHVEAVMSQNFSVVAQCHSNGPCPIAAQRLIDISAEGAKRSGRARVGLINRAANLAISPVSDERQWALRIIGAIRLKRFCRIAATARITQSSNMRRCSKLAFPRMM